jgi:hypothetical protein
MNAIILKGAALRQPPLPQRGPWAKTIAHPCPGRYSNWLRARRPRGRSSSTDRLKDCLFSISSWMVLGQSPQNSANAKKKIGGLYVHSSICDANRVFTVHNIIPHYMFRLYGHPQVCHIYIYIKMLKLLLKHNGSVNLISNLTIIQVLYPETIYIYIYI